MIPRTMIAVITLAALPFFATAAAQHPDHHSSQAAIEQSTGSTMMDSHQMGQSMMNLIDQVKNDLAALANVNDPAVLHKRLAEDQSLLEQIQVHMRSMQGMTGQSMTSPMMSGGMMSGHMSNGSGMAHQPSQQPQK